MISKSSILDVNPLGRLTSDAAISQYNYESIMNGLVEWDTSKMDTVTVRLATKVEPYFTDYTISTKHSYDSSSQSVASLPYLNPGCFSYASRIQFVSLYGANNTGDMMNVRVNVLDAGDTTHDLYAEAAIYDEIVKNGGMYAQATTYTHSYTSGLFFRRSEVSSGIANTRIYVTTATITSGSTISVGVNCQPYIVSYGTDEYNASTVKSVGQLVIYNGNVYKCTGDIATTRYTPDNPRSGFTKVCSVYETSGSYDMGECVVMRGEMFVRLNDSTSASTPKSYDGLYVQGSDIWKSVVLLEVQPSVASGVVRAYAPSDTVSLLLRNGGTTRTSESTEIHVYPTIRIRSAASKSKNGVTVINTSNYSRWPGSSPKWDGSLCGPTDETRSVRKLQDYTAKMVFNHGDSGTTKTNIISYDGPDLDQGLAIFLPTTVTMSDGTVSDPEDGYTFEFVIRIWPNSALNGHTANDLIVNKSQVYVYGITDYTDFDWSVQEFGSGVYPIAKFSMARMTNFYVFGENIGVPDRPTVYKARFIYSKDDGIWRTFDYYQFPDHVFMSPGGYIDPTSKESSLGIETGGFPVFQDPFSDIDLSPVRVTEGYTAYVNDV